PRPFPRSPWSRSFPVRQPSQSSASRVWWNRYSFKKNLRKNSLVPGGRRFLARQRLDRGDRGLGGGVDLRLAATQVEAAIGAVRGHVDQLDVGGLLGLVGGERGVGGGLRLEDVERLTGLDHLPEADLVEDH